MKLIRWLFMFAALLAGGVASSAGFLEREVVFSEAEIQAALAKAKPQQLSYGGLVSVSLKEPPRILLDGDDGRARIAAELDIEMPGQPPLRVDVAGRAGLRYDDRNKAFYLEQPVTDSVSAPTLRKEATPALRQAVTQLMVSYFRTKPVYVLRENGSPQEITARWLLKSVRIEPGRVVAVLSPV
ncbi:MAG: DUF1439 domain-containing protein [Rhodocyclales bacterium]|nr:DUF1439 domain-containing protein [Rhodocyclales bacterium]